MEARLSEQEKQVLKELAKQVSEVAADPKWKEKDTLWTNLNDLKKTRPMVLCSPQGGWQELIPNASYKVKDEFFAYYERHLSQLIYRSKFIHDDEIISKDIYIPYEVICTDWIDGVRERPYDPEPGRANTYHPFIIETADIKKLRHPTISIDEKKSNENFELAHELFGDHLNVIHGEPYYSFSLPLIKGWGASIVDLWFEFRGMERAFFDFVDEPEFTKDAMQFIGEGIIKILKEGERLKIWRLNNNGFIKESVTPCGSCAAANTSDLPAPDYSGTPRLKDMWGYTMAQEYTTISPDMLEEFLIPYQVKICELFGLNSYGCCENNDKKWDIILKNIPRLRQLSVSPYSNFELAVNKMQDKYVLAWKPKPADMLLCEPEYIRAEMSRAMEIAKDAHLAIVLREIETVYNDPKCMQRWVDITMELAEKYM